MEVTALSVRLWINGMMLLLAQVQQSHAQTSVSDAAFLRIVPSRLQLFEYESVSFTCEGFNVSAGCKVRNIKEIIPKCSNRTATSTVTCTINYAYPSDSGGYWCEGEGGEISSTVNITVTAGSAILESPVLPVMEGDGVTLQCRNKTTFFNLTVDFYKDGLHIETSSTGNMTIERVLKSHEGLYKCNISGVGESPESWLAVRGSDVIMESPVHPVTEGDAVTLRCRKQETSSDLKADFFKDGHLIRNSSAGEMTIHSVSKSDEGLYKCSISGAGESPESWLLVEASDQQEINFSRHYKLLLWIIISVVLVLQLLVIGLLYRKKQLVLLETKMNDPKRELRNVVKKGGEDEPFVIDDTSKALQYG
ncbi:high affinity immunoglobulin epsilon receptor subunit alpha-like [Chaetodon trifascialis]|uniref:high affinity immunoglobulin epsilon receptor subunit alpha-like n=1 Tax=Chaetodon trifascialis TaxID=109706 RepID=UPI003992828E